MINTIKRKISHLNNSNTFYLRKKALCVISVVLIFTFIFYGYFLSKTVLNTVALNRDSKEITKLNINITAMETKYMTEKSKITIDLAYQKGFKDVSPDKYITKKSLGSSLTINK